MIQLGEEEYRLVETGGNEEGEAVPYGEAAMVTMASGKQVIAIVRGPDDKASMSAYLMAGPTLDSGLLKVVDVQTEEVEFGDGEEGEEGDDDAEDDDADDDDDADGGDDSDGDGEDGADSGGEDDDPDADDADDDDK
jgi:hypothetical protein